MAYQFEFRPYRRRFRHPLKTHHGHWTHREGIIVRLMDDAAQVGYGEIAPLPWFGSETLEQAMAVCKKLPKTLSVEMISSIPADRPTCRFGFESALMQCVRNHVYPRVDREREDACIQAKSHPPPPRQWCALLPTGEAALQAWPPFWEAGRRTFKVKIGVAPIQAELDRITRLVSLLPMGAKVRLDANGGLTLTEAHQWLAQCDQLGIEFLEQPLPPNQLPILLQLSQQYQTPIALDESVATVQQLKYAYGRGWRGIFTVKPAIAGFPSELKQFCQAHPLDVVFSSVFETAIGRDAILTLAADILRDAAPFKTGRLLQTTSAGQGKWVANPAAFHSGVEGKRQATPRAFGFGTQDWLAADGLDLSDFDHIWRSL
ncbi:MAG: o-succinylbenzoate synthase [Leptolyngbyaceae cyanobacterium MO_188.B28]|nr:o-succinylbenzoate synthase [Leptolyngbyaceae cyanobacterium MO_188.B28]